MLRQARQDSAAAVRRKPPSASFSMKTSVLLLLIVLSSVSWFVLIGSNTHGIVDRHLREWELRQSFQMFRPNNKDDEQDKMVIAQSKLFQNMVGYNQTTITPSRHTVVTAYFQLRSKFAASNYMGWMKNMLSLQDPMVIFTSPSLVATMQEFRQHAVDRTIIIPIPNPLNETLPIAQYPYDYDFWLQQWERDPERRIHRSVELYWIWLSKPWFVVQAMDLNPFSSEIFVWSDIGCFRRKKYNFRMMVQHYELIPRNAMLQMAHHPTDDPPKYVWWNNKYDERISFYHSGSQMAGYNSTWRTFAKEAEATVAGFVQRNMFIGEDQTVLQSTCLRIPNLCLYVPTAQVKGDNHYFGLRYVLHYGGTYQYWSPPKGLPLDEKDAVALEWQNRTKFNVSGVLTVTSPTAQPTPMDMS